MSPIASLPNLPPAIARYTLYLLTEALPPPISDLPEELAARDEAAIAAVALLDPADAFEARLAARAVATDAHAMDSLRLAGQPGATPEQVQRCRAQATAMLRASDSATRQLERRQAARAKAQPLPVQEAEPAPAAAAAPATDWAAEADRYALAHGKRAALIRRLGRLPHKLDFGPIRPELVRAIITGTSPALLALDSKRQRPMLAAA